MQLDWVRETNTTTTTNLSTLPVDVEIQFFDKTETADDDISLLPDITQLSRFWSRYLSHLPRVFVATEACEAMLLSLKRWEDGLMGRVSKGCGRGLYIRGQKGERGHQDRGVTFEGYR